MLAPLTGTSNEHKAGANIFRNADLVFQFEKMMRFTDKTLIEILEVMRTPKPGKLLTKSSGRNCAQLMSELHNPTCHSIGTKAATAGA